MRMVPRLGLLLMLTVGRVGAAEPRAITGRIVDEQGRPVADAAIDFFWSADGPMLLGGKPRDLSTAEAEKLYSTQIGQMEPVVNTTSDVDGRFSLETRGAFYGFMAMDADRKRGALVIVPKDHDGSAIEVRLQPLVRVEATINSDVLGFEPEVILAVTEVPADPARPLAMPRLVLAEARDSRLLMSLPPGSYVLDAYDGKDFKTRVRREFTVKGDKTDLDLGLLKLLPDKPSVVEAIEQSQAIGAMGDYTQNYGKPLPAWNIVDARGVAKDVQLADFKGKWLLLNFWALNCAPCLKDELPRLARFYEDHEAQRDRFEIVAICVDHNGEMDSIAEVDRALEPIVEHVWNGKPLPFPVLLDPSLATLERFGVPGYQTLLVDPDGRLVEGNEETLAKKLEENTQ